MTSPQINTTGRRSRRRRDVERRDVTLSLPRVGDVRTFASIDEVGSGRSLARTDKVYVRCMQNYY